MKQKRFLYNTIDECKQIKVSNHIGAQLQNAYLRVLLPADISQKYLDSLNDPECSRYILFASNETANSQTLKEYVVANYNDNSALLLGFFIGEDFCGTVRLSKASIFSADLGIFIFKKSLWGKSWGTKILFSVAKFVFEECGIKNIRAGIDVDNLASIRAFEKAGFVRSTNDPQDYSLGKFILMNLMADQFL